MGGQISTQVEQDSWWLRILRDMSFYVDPLRYIGSTKYRLVETVASVPLMVNTWQDMAQSSLIFNSGHASS